MRAIASDARRRILAIARAAIRSRVEGRPPPVFVERDLSSERRGLFVTVRVAGQLRGCIGHIEADQPLVEIVGRCATAACSDDPRFPPLTEADLAGLEVEVSLLGDLEPAAGPDDVSIGRHGLLVEQGSRRGLLLPQVAVEWDWDRAKFVAETCRKAGLPPDAWQRGARLWRFEAEVISETDAAGSAS